MQATVLQTEPTASPPLHLLEIGRFKAAGEQVFSGLMAYVEAGLPIDRLPHMAGMIAGAVQAHVQQATPRLVLVAPCSNPDVEEWAS